jgi:hypothetical protein
MPDKMRVVIELLINSFIKTINCPDGKLVTFLALGKLPNMTHVHPFALVFYNGPKNEGRKFSPLYITLNHSS